MILNVNVLLYQNGRTAFMHAISHGKANVVQVLLEKSADPNTENVIHFCSICIAFCLSILALEIVY